MNCVAVIDLKAFYASVECVERGLDPFTTPLIVCDETRGKSTIVLSVTPYLKSLGVPNVCRRRDLPHIPNLIYAMPRMGLYVQKSAQIVDIFLDYIAEEDLHVYSIDESFLNLGPYLKLYDKSPEDLVKEIIKRIKDETGLTATAGISYNPFMAKVCNDLDGKKNAPDYISTWTEEDVEKKLWKISPLSKVWGINTGYERRLNALGIRTMYELAHTDVDVLRSNLGIMGEQLWNLANGRDEANIREKYIPKTTSFSTGQTLYRDFSMVETRTLLREMSDNLCQRLHENNLETNVVAVAILYSAKIKESRGFSHQVKLIQSSDDNEEIYEVIMNMYDSYIEDYPIRRIYIGFGGLQNRTIKQLSLFDDNEEKELDRAMIIAMEQIQNKYGKSKIHRATALLEDSTYLERANQIGGHRK